MRDKILEILEDPCSNKSLKAYKISELIKSLVIESFDIGQANYTEPKNFENGKRYYEWVQENTVVVVDILGDLKIKLNHINYE